MIQDNDFVGAKRGQFAVVRRDHSSASLRGGIRRWSEYLPATVVSVTRDGVVKAVELHGGIRCIPDRLLGFAEILTTDAPAAPILAALGNVTWKSLDEARAVVRAAMP